MSIPNIFRHDDGKFFSGKAAGALSACYALTLDSAGKITTADSTTLRGVGICANDVTAAGDTVRYHKGGRSTVKVSSATSIVPGVYLKIGGTPGLFVAESTPTVATIASWGIAKETPDADGLVLMEWL